MRTCGMPFYSRFCSTPKFQLDLNLKAVNVPLSLFQYKHILAELHFLSACISCVYSIYTCMTIFSCRISFSRIYLSTSHLLLCHSFVYQFTFHALIPNIPVGCAFHYCCCCCCCCRRLVLTKINK